MMSLGHLIVSLTLLSSIENFGTLGSTPMRGGTPLTTLPAPPVSNQGGKPTPNMAQTPMVSSAQGPLSTQLSTLPVTMAISTVQNQAQATSRFNPPQRMTTFPQGSPANNNPQTFQPTPLPKTAQPSSALTSVPIAFRQTQMRTAVSTDLSNLTPLPSTPQRCQFTFDTKYTDLATTELDMWVNRPMILQQLANDCQTSQDRITDIALSQNSTGYFVLRFSIQQGWPVPLADAMQNLMNALNKATFLQVSGVWLNPPVVVRYWTDTGACPNDTCVNGGVCNVTLDNKFNCACVDGYNGSMCEMAPVKAPPQNKALFALLVLLIIPIAIALIIGFIFGLRKQQKMQLKRAFDLRDVRTIGPKSMLSLPQEPGMRNQMYDTRSFALAFTDNTFNKGDSIASSEEPLSAVFNSA